MKIVETLADIRGLEASGQIPADLARYLERKLRRICEAVGETPVEEFSLALHGPIGILEKGDRSLAGLGLPEALDLLMPEWVSRLELKNSKYFLAYFVHDNDCVPVAVIPEEVAAEAILAWLKEQPIEDESDDEGGDADAELPEPF